MSRLNPSTFDVEYLVNPLVQVHHGLQKVSTLVPTLGDRQDKLEVSACIRC